MTSPPAVIDDMVVVGSAIDDNSRVDMPSGVVRAFDARRKAALEMGTVAAERSWLRRAEQREDLAYWRRERLVGNGGRSGARFVFVLTGSASPDYYGGMRAGDDKWADSVVALRAKTGELVWGFQLVHHDHWDYYSASPMMLATVPHNGKNVPVVIQGNKTGFLYVLNRETGVPLFPVVTPFFGYARQDKKNRGREPISARLMADLFATAGADRLMAVDLHTAQIQGFFDGPVDHLFALSILARDIQKTSARSRWWRRTPAGSGSASGGRTGSAARWPSSTKVLTRTWPTRSGCSRWSARWPARTCILVDDMIDTGATIAKAAEALFEQGADRVIATATHGVLSGAAVDVLKNSTDQRDHHHEHAARPTGEAVRQADRAVDRAVTRARHQRGIQRRSVTSLFDGKS